LIGQSKNSIQQYPDYRTLGSDLDSRVCQNPPGTRGRGYFDDIFEEEIPFYLCCGIFSSEKSKKKYIEKRPPNTGIGYRESACLPGNGTSQVSISSTFFARVFCSKRHFGSFFLVTTCT